MKLKNEIDVKELIVLDKPIIVECGANNGSTTSQFLSAFPQAKVFCFEPDPRNVKNFRKRIHSPNCKLYEVAVANVDGYLELAQSYGIPPGRKDDHLDASTIKGIKCTLQKFSWLKYKEPIQIKAIKLDTWFFNSGIESIDFIWADVEGAEEDLIKGGLRVLERTHYFYTEYCDVPNYDEQINSDDILKLLPNFEIVKKWKVDMLLHNRKWR